MKTQRIFPGVLLIGVGCYYLLQQFSIPFAEQVLSWPSLLFVIGSALLLQGYLGLEYSLIFPGALLVGLALQFHLISIVSWWPEEHWGVYTCIVGMSFLLSARKTKREGYFVGSVLIIFSLLSFASINPIIGLYDAYSFLSSLWPIFLIGLGCFFLFKRK